jgi:hypothetical protein
MSLIAMLIGSLRVLLCAACVFLALGMFTLAVVFGSGPVRLGGVFVMFGSLVVLIPSHFSLVGYQLPVRNQIAASRIVPNPNERLLDGSSSFPTRILTVDAATEPG